MSKTFTYVLIVIGVYVAIITGKTITGNKKTEEEKKTGKSDDAKSGSSENGVSQGASGQMKYRIGARSTK